MPYALVKGLLPCPCCLGRAYAWRYPTHETPRGCGELYEVRCCGCELRTGQRHSLAAAVIVWQRRRKRYGG
jgi:hypothetical protein